MTIQTATITNLGDGSMLASWPTPVAAADTGSPVEIFGKKFAVSIQGTFATGGQIQIEGSVDGTNWTVLNDLGNNAISAIAAAVVKLCHGNVRYVRPKLNALTSGVPAIVTSIYVPK